MKGLYICTGQDLNDLSSGIGKKINNQIKVMKKNDYNIDVINIDNYTNFIDRLLFFTPLFKSKYELRQLTAVDDYKLKDYLFIYIRKPALTPTFVKLLKNIKKQNNKIKIIMEIPTFPIYGEYKGIRKLLILPSIFTSATLYKYVDRIVTYSNDRTIWNVKTISVSNSVNFEMVSPKKVIANEGDINVIAVALFSHWHGYDRFIEGLNVYYKNGGQRQIHLYFVGDSEIVQQYKSLTKKYNLFNNIHFMGKRYGEQLDEIYDRCELALDALARHRSKVYYNSSLKGKEYGAKGLPIISGVETELDNYKDYKYYFRVPADESPLDINSIVEFYDTIYNNNETKVQVINSIRTYSYELFDFESAFRPVMNYINF